MCNFVHVGDMVYYCEICDITHKCGLKECQHLEFNKNQTRVCTITGRCFDQLMSDEMGNYRDEPIFVPRVKRDQQVRNKIMTASFVNKILNSCPFIPQEYHHSLVGQICRLWDIVIQEFFNNRQYIHRHIKRQVVAAVLFSLESGLTNYEEVIIVAPHPHISVAKINKKSTYEEFKISDIRDGIKILKYEIKGLYVETPIWVPRADQDPISEHR